jgi:arylformamidase
MKIIDISWPLSEDITGYKNEKDIHFLYERKFEEYKMRKSKITLSSHVGTHVDAPAYFLLHGQFTEFLGINNLIGSALVLDFQDFENKITSDLLKKYKIPKKTILLLKTKNSKKNYNDFFDYNFVYLTSDAAQYCIDIDIKAIGIDYLRIERDQPNHETHIFLMGKNTPIMEDLRLNHVKEGTYFFVCLPLAIQGLEAAPARAILIEDFKLFE